MSRIQVDNILDKVGDGAPTFPNGLVSSGVVTATSFVGSGASLTGIDATSLKDGGGTIRVQANTSGIVATGVVTATSFKGDGSGLSGVESGVSNFVASGTIPNGATVVINTDGTVGIVTSTGSPTPSVGSSVVFNTGTTGTTSCAYDSTNGKVVIAYQDGSNLNYGTAIVGTVSGTSISFGTEVVFAPVYANYNSIDYDSASNKVVIAYKNESNNTVSSIVGTVSGTSISFGSALQFHSSSVYYLTTTYVSSSKVVITYMDSGNSNRGTSIVGTVSGTSISFGSAVVFDSPTDPAQYISTVYDSTNGKVVIVYRDGSTNYGKSIVGTVSGTSISFGTAVVFNTANSTQISTVYDSTNGKVVIAYANDSNAYGTAIVGTVSGTSISFGTAVVFDNTGTTADISTTYDSTNEKVVISYRDVSNSSYGTAIVGTVSGNSISFGTAVVFNNTGITYQISTTYDSTNGKVVIAYQDDGNLDYGTSVVFGTDSLVTNLTAENYIGIAAEAISDTATGKITTTGGINSGQTGLTTAQTYYVQNTGGIGTITSSPSVVAGTSVSDTKVLVWKS